MAQVLEDKTKNVAYLGTVIPSLSATFIYREILEIERRGYSLHIYSLHRPDPKSLSAESLPLCARTYYLLPVRILRLLFAHFHYVSVHPIRYFRAIWKMLIPVHDRLKNRIRSLLHFGEGVVLAYKMEQDDISHIHSHYASQATSVARVIHLLTGIPYSFSAHAHDIWHDRLLLREKLDEACFVSCCSSYGCRELSRRGNAGVEKKIHVIYHGIDVRHFIPPSVQRRNGNQILAVGRFDLMKGFSDLVTACHYLQREGVMFQCCIVGGGEEMGNIESLVRKYGLAGRIHLPGAIPQERLLQFYHEATIFTLPCISTRNGRHDGIPNVLVEAMATALPVVSTPIGGIAELIDHEKDGFLVKPGNTRELAARLKQLLQDAALRRRFAEAGRTKICSRFDNQKCIEPLINLLERKCGLRSAKSDGRSELQDSMVDSEPDNRYAALL